MTGPRANCEWSDVGGKVVRRQVAAALIVAGGFLFFQGTASAQQALAALYGGVIAILLSLLLTAQLRRLDKRLENKEMVTTGLLLVGIAPRMILTLAAFVFGIAALQLPPLPMLAAFVVCYLAYWMSLREARK